MPSQLDTHATNKHAMLVTFSWGSGPTVTRYCRWDQHLTVDGNVYTSEPLLQVAHDAQHGGVKDAPWQLRMSLLSPLDKLARVYPHALVTATIAEIDPLIPASHRILFVGQISKVKKNPGGARGLVEAQVSGLRARLAFAITPFANSTCINIFGDPYTCGIDVSTLTQTGTVSTISKNKLTITGLTYPRSRYFRFGWVEHDGLRIQVLEDLGGGVFNMQQLPPPEWAAAVVIAAPGCSKGLDGLNGCRIWENESRYNGLGVKIPAYLPIVEDGG